MWGFICLVDFVVFLFNLFVGFWCVLLLFLVSLFWFGFLHGTFLCYSAEVGSRAVGMYILGFGGKQYEYTFWALEESSKTSVSNSI